MALTTSTAPPSARTSTSRRDPQGHPTPRASLELGLGLVAFPIGVGIGLPHVAKTGWTAATVVGLVLLVFGVVLIGVGAVGLVRARGGWRRWLVTIPGILVAVVLATAVLGQAVGLTTVPATRVGQTSPGSVGLDYRDVEFSTPDGVTLSGWYVPSRNGAAVALLHGAGSTRSAVLPHAVVLARNGYGVLLFDARGHGRSEGRAMDAGWYGDEDLRGAITFLAAQADVDPSRIGAVGMSMGGEEAVGAVAAEPKLRAVVAEGVTNRTAEDLTWLSDVYGWRGAVTEVVHWLVYATADALSEAERPIALRDAVAAAPGRPVLLIAGGATIDEGHAAAFIASGSPASVQVWVAPGAGHVGALAAQPSQWEEQVAAFLATTLGAG